MSEEKRLELEIGWYKVIFAIFVATDISLVAWIVQNIERASVTVLSLALAGVFSVSVVLYLINRRVFKCLERVEEL